MKGRSDGIQEQRNNRGWKRLAEGWGRVCSDGDGGAVKEGWKKQG